LSKLYSSKSTFWAEAIPPSKSAALNAIIDFFIRINKILFAVGQTTPIIVSSKISYFYR
jgi:hypothetical protein